MASTLALNFLSCMTAMATLCMSMGRHQPAVFGARCSQRRTIALRGAGWSALALSFALATSIDGPVFGPVHWLGTLIAAALLVVGLLSYRPDWLGGACLVSLISAAAGGLTAWFA